jgi:hypothetical protein
VESKEDRADTSRDRSTLKKMRNERDDREHQQEMNQKAGNVEDQEPAHPRKQQNCKQDDEHESLLILCDRLLPLGQNPSDSSKK